MRILLFLALLWVQVLSGQPADLDSWVTRTQKQFEVPGIAVAIVKDGQTVVAKGYGVRVLGKPGEVDAHTLFGIASNSKAFTAAALAMLVDEGKLSWDDPVQKHLPQFQMASPYVTREVTIRDLLSHRTGMGLGAGDLLYWPDTTFTREQVIRAARHLPVDSSFRSRYAYNNLGYVVAGEVVAAVSGKRWEDFVRERILQPLRMTETRITSAGMDPERDNVTVPHSRGWRLAGELKPIRPTRDEVWAAAAGLKSNLTDLARWVTLQLNQGKLPDGEVLFSEKQAREMWTPQIALRVAEPHAALATTKANFAAYGLGWNLRDYQGRKIVSHTGGLTGMVSLTLMVPEEKLGIVVLTNQEEGGAFQAIAYHILDHYLGSEPRDWIGAYAESTAERRRKDNEEEAKTLAARTAGTTPSLALTGYAGEYADAWYGPASLSTRGDSLYLRFGGTPDMHGPLEHFHHNTFIVRWADATIPDAFVDFSLATDGTVEGFRMKATSPLADFSFDYHNLHFRPAKSAAK
ncbi:MAG: serine hydrolase [Bryobacterales bacterium]|nr:serine hydrolase [Bryobacterales bacterium]